MPLWVMLMLMMMMMFFWLLFPWNIPSVFSNYKNHCLRGFWFLVWRLEQFGFIVSSHVMAQLPPKVPAMAANWPSFPHQKIPSMGNLAPPATQNPSWVDEFLDFSSAKRGTHRRSVSDSIAFFEAPDDCRNSGAAPRPPGAGNEFDQFDDEQFMSMFTDAMAPTISSSNPSTPSDHYSFNEEKTTTIEQQQQQQQLKNESEEVQSSCKLESQTPPQPSMTTSNDRIVDPKRVKRLDFPSFSRLLNSNTCFLMIMYPKVISHFPSSFHQNSGKQAIRAKITS